MEDIKKRAEFSNKLDKFIESQSKEESDYGDLVQEVLGFGAYYSYLNCANPEEVDWFVRKIKQLALKDRKEIDKKIMEELS